jgi:hypothetical protein
LGGDVVVCSATRVMRYDDWGVPVCWGCTSVLKGVQTLLVVMVVMVQVMVVVVVEWVVVITGRLVASGSCWGAGS